MTLSPGVTAMLILLPATMFHLLLAARSVPARLLALPAYLPGLEELWSPQALLLLFVWLGLQVALYLLPARKVCVRSVLMHQGGECREGWTGEGLHIPYKTCPVPAGGRRARTEGQESPALPY